MAYQIIKQPNGNFAVYSSVAEDFVMFNGSEQDLVEFYLVKAKREITEFVKNTVEALNSNKTPYHQFTVSYEDLLEGLKEKYTLEEFEEIKNAKETTKELL